MTAPTPFLTIEARRAIWARLWRECLLRPRPDAPDHQVAEDRPAPTPDREPAELRPETDDAA